MGYGTQSPSSITGKAIGGVCAIVGVFILTLPVPIVVNSFAAYYKNRLWRNEVAHKRRIRASEQAKLVKELFISTSRRPSFEPGAAGEPGDGGGSVGAGGGGMETDNRTLSDQLGAALNNGGKLSSRTQKRRAFASVPKKNNNSVATDIYLSVPSQVI